MQDLPIAKQIQALNKLALTATLLVAVIGVAASLWLTTVFRNFVDTTKRTEIVQEISEDVFEGRIAAFKYRISPNEGMVSELNENLVEAVEAKERLLARLSNDPDNLQLVENLGPELTFYDTAFAEMVELQNQRDVRVANMFAVGDEAGEKLGRLMQLAFATGDATAAYYAGLTLRDLLVAKHRMERYLLVNETADFEAARDHVMDAISGIKTLQPNLASADKQALGSQVAIHFDDYLTRSDEVFETISARNAIRARLDEVGPRVQANLDNVGDSTVAEQQRLGPQAILTGWLTMGILIVIAAGSVALLALRARKVEVGITEGLNGSVETMNALAGGDLKIEIRDAEKETELGEVARALLVFRDNLRETGELRKQQEQERKKAEEERMIEAKKAEEMRHVEAEAQRKAVIDELTSSVGKVVDAAAHGEFSLRVDSQFEDPQLQELASSINEMMDRVETSIAGAAGMLKTLAEGDLTVRMPGVYTGIFDSLANDLDRTAETLAGIVAEITRQSQEVGQSSEELNEQSGELARGAEQQATALEDTTSTMEEIATNAQSSADAATRAENVAQEANKEVAKASTVVNSAVEAMAEFRDFGSKIGEIVAVIDSIAFQTNLLALNASVEAARAGDAGKGFAVVASEVRGLTQRSGEASSYIKSLIDESTQKIGQGVELVERTGQKLEQIVSGFDVMANTMRELIAAAKEQASGVQDVNRAMGELDQITQQNARLADNSRQSGMRLSAQTEEMRGLVNRFVIEPRAAAIAAE